MGILAWRGQVVEMAPSQFQRLMGNIGDRSALGGYARINDWNQCLVMARGPVCMHITNGQLMAVFVDDDPMSSNNQSGMVRIASRISRSVAVSMGELYASWNVSARAP